MLMLPGGPVRVIRLIGLATLLLVACSKQTPLRIAVVGGYGSPLGAVLATQDINASGGSQVFQGITGPISFDANGDARPAYVLLEITPTGMRPVHP